MEELWCITCSGVGYLDEARWAELYRRPFPENGRTTVCPTCRGQGGVDHEPLDQHPGWSALLRNWWLVLIIVVLLYLSWRALTPLDADIAASPPASAAFLDGRL